VRLLQRSLAPDGVADWAQEKVASYGEIAQSGHMMIEAPDEFGRTLRHLLSSFAKYEAWRYL
jgi:hypothetical protein